MPLPAKPTPRRTALLIAERVQKEHPNNATLWHLAEAIRELVEECEALNRSKAEDRHGH